MFLFLFLFLFVFVCFCFCFVIDRIDVPSSSSTQPDDLSRMKFHSKVTFEQPTTWLLLLPAVSFPQLLVLLLPPFPQLVLAFLLPQLPQPSQRSWDGRSFKNKNERERGYLSRVFSPLLSVLRLLRRNESPFRTMISLVAFQVAFHGLFASKKAE